MGKLGMRIVIIMAALVVSGWNTGCRFVGTPEEEILRAGGKIEHLSSGGCAVTLSGAQVVDNHMLAVAALGSNHPKYQPVRTLDISGSKVSDLGLDALQDLASLESLKLPRTNVTEAGVNRFRERIPHCQIIRD